MKKRMLRLIALLLACLLLTGCGTALQKAEQLWGSRSYVAYADMVYARPDMVRMQQLLDEAVTASQGEDLTLIVDRIQSFYDFYDDFYTNYSLADLHYSADLTDLYWDKEYNYCVENSTAVDAALEELYYALARSPMRKDLEQDAYFGPEFFDSYEGENNWDETFTTLLEQEAALQMQYYGLSEEALDHVYGTEEYYEACGREMAQLLVDLIGLRQQIAACWGYSDYRQFAADFYYYRDYTPAQSERYLQDICRELVPLYRECVNSEKWDAGYAYCSEEETYAYVRETAQSMGGIVAKAFRLMDSAGLYDISYGENKFDSSFEIYLDTYREPFVFLCPDLTVNDKLVFAHEFGHFCNDYASYGSYAGIDVAEVFSQGMEYLSLCYGENRDDLVWLKMADSLCLFVEQSAFATFEQRMYGLTGEELTVENLRALYDEVALEFGFDAAEYVDWEFVTIPHFYSNPMYIIGYVVSNDAAMQLYQMEQEEKGAGLQCFEDNLTTECTYFLEFLESAGLESPFVDGRMEAVRQTFEEILE